MLFLVCSAALALCGEGRDRSTADTNSNHVGLCKVCASHFHS